MLGLLCNEGFMRRLVQSVSTASKLLDTMIFKLDFGEWVYSDMASRAYCYGIQFRDVCKSVVIRVISI